MDNTSFIQTNNFSEKIKTVQWILSILVIFIHTNNIKTYSLSFSNGGFEAFVVACETLLNVLGGIAVPMFFLISGFLFYNNYDYSRVGSKYSSRLKSVLIPFICWNVIYFIYFFALTHIPLFAQHMNMKTVELTLSNILSAVIFYKYCNPFWFMFQLIIYISASPLIYTLLKNKTVGVMLFAMVLNLAFLGIHSDYFPTGLYFFLYILGGYAVIHFKEKIIHPYSYKQNVLFAVVAAVTLVVTYYITLLSIEFDWDSIFSVVLRTIEIVSVWFAIDLIRLPRLKPWITISFFIYAAHFLLLETIEKILLIMLGKGAQAAWADYIIAPAIVLIIIYFAAYLLKRFFPPVWNVLNGWRLQNVGT